MMLEDGTGGGTLHDAFDRRRIAAFVLVGGRSRRMGHNKARLPWQGTTLVQAIQERLHAVVATFTLVAKSTRDYADLQLPVLCDPRPQHALVHGIEAALLAPGPPWRLLLACDMPGVDADIVRALWRHAQEGGTGSYPQQGNHAEPLPSLWHHGVGRRIEADWGLRAQDWLQHAGLTPWPVADEDRRRLANLNTPEDWRAWLAQQQNGDERHG
jgi:molybdopterin-guanine dinucleotide biosynthesis protein A